MNLAFGSLDEMIKKFQRLDESIRNKRVYFDNLPEDYPSLSHQLYPDSQTVQDPHIASGLTQT